MFKSYLKTTYRYLRANKLFTMINIVGLATALCVTFFAFLYVKFELSYDDFHTNKERIYRVSTNVKTAYGINQETSCAPLAGALSSTFPEIESATRIFLDYFIVQKGDEPASEETVAYADTSLFSVFSFSLLRGNKATLFDTPFSMLLTASTAKKYFGTIDCLGETLMLDGNTKARVTGVMKDIPGNSHFKTGIMLAMSSLIAPESSWMSDWNRFGFSTYVLFKKNADAEQVIQKLPAFVQKQPVKETKNYALIAEPLDGLYLNGSHRGNKAGATFSGNRSNIYIFSLVAFFILLVACFNFINLKTALSLNRSKEIGIRKVSGASKSQLVFQFLTDAVVVAVIGSVVAFLLCYLLYPWFNSLAGKIIVARFQDNLRYGFGFFLVAVAVGLLAGLYPAFFLSSFQPAISLKGKNRKGHRSLDLRKSLVVLQFTTSIILIVSTIVIFRQLDFMQNEVGGFTKKHDLVIDYHYDQRITAHPETVKNLLTENAGITMASLSSCIPGRPNRSFPTSISAADNTAATVLTDAWFIDYDFIKQYGLQLVAGRGFSESFKTDLRESMIVNEAMVHKLGYRLPGDDIIGKLFTQRGATGKIIGVVKDFHFHAAHEEIQPLTLMVSPGFFTFLTISLNTSNPHQLVNEIGKKWKQIAPGLPMIYFFTDDVYNAQYQAEGRFGKLFTCFAVLAIIISVLGLFGLVAFSNAQRRKEIGIRKVLGANVQTILQLLSREFLLLVLLAFLIAAPVAYYFMYKWLNEFAYRVHIQWWVFAAAGGIAILSALVTIIIQSLRTAYANPVKILRTE